MKDYTDEDLHRSTAPMMKVIAESNSRTKFRYWQPRFSHRVCKKYD